MSELSPEGGSEGYGAGSDEAAPAWSSWRARNCRALRACWMPEHDLCAGDGGDHPGGSFAGHWQTPPRAAGSRCFCQDTCLTKMMEML